MDLTAEIEAELAWVVEGAHPGSELELAVRDAVRGVLARHRIRPRRVVATCTPSGTVDVQIELPPQAPRIRAVRLRVR